MTRHKPQSTSEKRTKAEPALLIVRHDECNLELWSMKAASCTRIFFLAFRSTVKNGRLEHGEKKRIASCEGKTQ